MLGNALSASSLCTSEGVDVRMLEKQWLIRVGFVEVCIPFLTIFLVNGVACQEAFLLTTLVRTDWHAAFMALLHASTGPAIEALWIRLTKSIDSILNIIILGF